jgi:hypothetical protein
MATISTEASDADLTALQYAIGTVADGVWGPASRKALIAAFTNKAAAGITVAETNALAARLGCSPAQIRAVASVESNGAGFDAQGRPKILFERHIFHRLTDGLYSPSAFSLVTPGGYDADSWEKLEAACGKDPDAAFSSTSWGKFQVLGSNWEKLGYTSPYELAHSTVIGEAAQYELFARYLETFGLKSALRHLSRDPAGCADFARLYNGPNFRANAYDSKLARAMT